MPISTPQIRAKAKSRMISPPNAYSAPSASSVVKLVITVRDRVSLRLRFSTSGSGAFL